MITPYYAGALGLLFSALSFRVIPVRRRTGVGFGTDGMTGAQVALVGASLPCLVPLAR